MTVAGISTYKIVYVTYDDLGRQLAALISSLPALI